MKLNRTGTYVIDAILDAIEDAGNCYHNVNEWHEEGSPRGTCAERIESAAEDAAKALEEARALADALDQNQEGT